MRLNRSLALAARRVKAVFFDVDGMLTAAGIIHGINEELKIFHSRDGLGFTMARAAGLKTGIVTGRTSQAVARRAQELKMDLVVQGAFDKKEALPQICSTLGLQPQELAYAGDDLLDVPLLSRVGLPMCPADAPVEVQKHCLYVAKQSGGLGAAREMIEFILLLQHKKDRVCDLFMHHPEEHR